MPAAEARKRRELVAFMAGNISCRPQLDNTEGPRPWPDGRSAPGTVISAVIGTSSVVDDAAPTVTGATTVA